MGQSFALIAEQQHDVANLGLRLEQLQTQPAAIDRLGILATLQRVAGSPIAKASFLRSALESCDFEIVTPSRAAISSAKRASVHLTRFVTGADRRGSATRKAACVFTGVGPGKGRVSKASTPLIHEFAAPKAHGVFANPKRLGNARAGPAPKRQENGSGPIRLGTVRSRRFRFQRGYLLLRRHNWRLARHAPSPESPRRTEL